MAHEKIVTAFSQIQQAEVAKEKLLTEGIAEKNIDIISGERLRVKDKEIRHPSFWQRLFGDDVDDSYASEYSRALQTGGVLLTVRADKEEAGRIEALLDQYATNYASGAGADVTAGAGLNDDRREFLGETDDRVAPPAGLQANRDFAGETDDRQTSPALSDQAFDSHGEELTPNDERLIARDEGFPVSGEALPTDAERESLKLAEEQVEIGKRQVNDGTVRLRRYTVEDHVAEDVSLYDQHAEVFRNAVDDPAYLNEVDWSDKTIEVEESHEVPTVSKSAYVKEEVGIRRSETERVETVKDTVRRQEVDIEQGRDEDELLRKDDDFPRK
ncbi:hypothetical protein PMPD1_0560 [Paramixta manurensis]|uniref:DUF2382 domain-containing protein n=1 Tax=Paramixta manurensis TaxID=2740817 RepID=A0A6M8U4G0_9GAMM|nr:hypothetical protein PMPD1_0560 [Erwiniaceae bacterium PD-1]